MENAELVARVLGCANKVAGVALELPPEGDLPLEAFGLDSLSLFAFLVEIENNFGVQFDEALLNDGELKTIRSTAAFIAARNAG